ncbi:non-ribosomal peptide synthetase [Cellulomonas sp. Leaf334]|uniref:non-ribosomal peptide synthetase n=1 Tax=Cellulomonas sp. Leaf334 TaxID=1736339 RepID=UPI0006FFB828|nr:non-ribosomal peptide synthetase [Cellulomonas sp. Leaf334]KQR16488.1 hypothetical protein ASF78_03675 [Cellulomonas sp. Leaf334]
MSSTTLDPATQTDPPADGWWPLTDAQRAIVAAQRLDPSSSAFVVADVLEVAGGVDVAALVGAVRQVVAETEALRVVLDGDRVRLGGPAQADVVVVDLSAHADPRAAATAWVDADLAGADGTLAQRHAVLVLGADETWWYQRYHHLLVDGYGVAALTRRVAARYRGEPVPPVPGDLAALWAQEHAYDSAEDTAFFLAMLGDEPPRTQLSDRSSPALRRARRVTVSAPAAILADERRLTWADVYAAAWAAFVGRRTGRDDVVLGLPVSARLTPEALRTVSLSVNVVPLRCAPARATTLRALAHEIAGTLAGVRRHQRARGEDLAARFADASGSWLLRGPGLNIKPFVETVRLGDAVGRLRTLTAGPVDDVDLTVMPDGSGGVHLSLEANPDVYDEDALAGLAVAFADFAAAVLAAPDLPLGRIPVDSVGAPVAPSPSTEPADVTAVLAATAAAHPDAPAVRDAAEALDLTALHTRVRDWAADLRTAGVGAEDVVALALPRGVDLVVGLLAVLEAGAAVLVVDLDYPPARIADLLTDARPALVLTTSDGPQSARPDAVLVRDGRLTVPTTGRAPATARVPHPDQTAYVVYTSGSTGKPKGVAVSRRSLAFLLDHHRRTLHGPVADAAGRQLLAAHTASFAFDSSWEQLLWLLLGHELLVLDEADRRDAHEIVALVERERVDTLDVTPSMAAALVDAGLLGSTHRLALLLIGGEAAPTELWQRLADSDVPSHNLYGPTEATVDALGAPVTGETPTIGVPLEGTAIRVLDAALQPVTTGELYLAGPHLARGYRDRPGLTAERFVADPWGAPGDRMYRTGDRVRVEADGSVSYLGRGDEQVKVRGYRIELGEVRAALAAVPGVRQAHAVVRDEPARLVGYVVASGVSGQDVQAALAALLPHHLVPSAVVVLDEFPTTVHGKLDVAALPVPGVGTVLRGTVRPATTVERLVCDAFAAVLGVADVAADDDFFLLAGDSISAIGVAAHLRAAGWRLRPRDVFGARTPRDLAPLLAPLVETVAVEHVAPTGEVPLPPVVADLLAAAPDAAALRRYAHSVRVPLPPVDDAAVRRALADLVDLHPALRVRLTGVDAGTPLLVVPATAGAPPLHVGARVDDLLDLLDPATGTVLVAARAGDELLLVIHHLAVDGVSWRVLLADLTDLLRGVRPAPEVSSWRGRALALAGRVPQDHPDGVLAQPCDLLGDRTAAGPPTRTWRTVAPVATRALVEDLPRALGTTPDVVLAAAVGVALQRVRGGSRLLLTWETHGRDPVTPGEDQTRTVGWFTTEFPVAVDLPGSGDLVDAARATADARDAVSEEGAHGPHRPQLLVNYLGRLGADGFAVHVPDALRPAHALEVNALLGQDGALAVEWTFAGTEDLADALWAAFDDVAVHAVETVRAGVDRRPARCTLPGVTTEALAGVPSSVVDVAPLSPLQEGLLFHALRDGAGDVYRTLTTVYLEAPVGAALDVERLARALRRVCAANPQLLAAFSADRFGAPAQLVGAAPGPEIATVDGAGSDLASIEREALARPFDVSAAPLLRAVLVRTAPDAVSVVLTAHHLVLDGWSTPLLVAALVDAYATDAQPADGYPAYRDYLRWVADQDRERSLATWAAHLADAEPCLLAPGSRGGADAGTVELRLDESRTRRLVGGARRAGLTLGSLVNGAWSLVLARETGRTDVVFGTTVSGRAAEVDGIDRVLGLLSTTVPVRVALAPDRPLVEQLAAHQAQRAALQEHEALGLADIEATSGRSGLFDTLVVVENYPERTSGRALDVVGVTNAGGTHYPFTLTVLPGAELRLVVEHDHARVTSADARRLGEAVLATLVALGDDPSVTPLALPVGVPAAVLVGPDPVLTHVVPAFLAAVARDPDAVAVRFGASTVTFAELAERAAAFQGAFAALEPDDVVALALPRGTDLVAAVVACLVHGVAYLPLDLAHPADRLQAAVRDADARCVVTGDPSLGAGRSVVDPDLLPPASGPLRARPVPGAAAAYVIFTSGSTGRPKGTVLTRDALDRHFTGLLTGRHAELVARTGRRRVRALHTASFAFDTSLIQLHWLFAGHELVLLDDDERRDPAVVVARIVQHRVDVVDVAPVLAEQLVAEGVLDGPWPLPELFLGGEAVPPALWTTLRAHPGTRTVNLYGPTEATVDALGAFADDADGPVVGRPVAGVTARVRDPWLRPVPVGVVGELYLSGPQLARGYLGQPGTTAERFVADPDGAPGDRAYRTGDAVRVLPDGLVEYVGRLDDQVKVGGHRVETGEVAAALQACDGVLAATVVVDGAHTSAARLVAAVTREQPADDDVAFVDGLRTALGQGLPRPWVPAVIAVVDRIPTTVTGKVDREALRRLAPTTSARDDLVAPATDAERAVVAAVAAVLGLPHVSVRDDFFALGGHSLTALRVLGALRTEGYRLTIRDVFEGRTLDRLASAARPVTAEQGTATLDDAVLRDGGDLPVSAAQRRLLVLEAIDGPGDTWTVPVTLLLDGPVDADRLRTAWQAVVDRHAVLRTGYVQNGGDFAARVLPVGTPATFEHAHVDDLPTAIAERERWAPDVLAEVPVRASLLQAAPDRCALVLAFHHLAIDDWSVAPLLEDLSAAYGGGVLTPLHPDEQFAAAVLAEVSDERDGIAAWRDRLAGLPAELDLSFDHARPQRAEHRGHTVSRDVPADAERAMAAVCARHGVTPVMVLQTAVATLYRRLGAGTDVCLGMAVARRDDPRLARAVGYLVDTVPVRLDVSGATTFGALLGRTRDRVLDALEHAWVPFERIVEAASPERSLARHPVFQTMVAVEDDVPHALDLPGITVRSSSGGQGAARLDVAVRWVAAGQPRLVLTVDAALLDEPSAQRWADRLLAWLERVLSDVDGPLTQIHALLPDEHGTDHVRRDRPPASVSDRVADQVLRAPHATAVVAADGTLDLLAVGSRAAAMADALRAQGIGREDVVAVALSRRSGLVAGLLGILAVGATYLPLDVEYPAERLAFMLDDAAPLLVLTDRDTAGLGVGRPELDVDALDVPARTPQQVADALRAPAGPHAAYTIYTSGSTGRPKGVVIPTDALAAFVDHLATTMQLVPTDRLVAVTTLSFDIAVLELFVPLVSGAAVVLADRDQVRDPDLLVGLARRTGCTHLQATPSLWRPLVEAHPEAFAGVHALVGGEALPPDLAVTLARSCAEVTNVYGPTEVTVWATSDTVRADEPTTIGRAFVDVGTHVLDADLQPVPPGVAGELYLVGAQLARGYHGRPSLTATRFVAGPSGERWYRTGDLVRRGADGRLHFLRRTDDQVKVNGFRIELGEVEAALRGVPDVHRAAAVVRADRLLGYVVAAERATLDPARVRAALEARVPHQLVPHLVTVVDALPLTLNGKVDRAALPDPVATTAVQGRGPATDAERAVCDVVAETLGVPAGPDDRFFELGGDSITAIRVVASLRTRGLALAPRDVFAHPVLADLAAAARPLVEAPPAARPARRARVALSAADLSTISALLGAGQEER